MLLTIGPGFNPDFDLLCNAILILLFVIQYSNVSSESLKGGRDFLEEIALDLFFSLKVIK